MSNPLDSEIRWTHTRTDLISRVAQAQYNLTHIANVIEDGTDFESPSEIIEQIQEIQALLDLLKEPGHDF
jgi:hypothetical protein